MKLLVDMNRSPVWVDFLTNRGIEAEHWSKVGSPSAPDSEIFAYAGANGFVVLTHDLDFGKLLAARKSCGPSVLQLRAWDILPDALGEAVVRAIHAARSYLEAGALVVIEPGRHRIRVLPI